MNLLAVVFLLTVIRASANPCNCICGDFVTNNITVVDDVRKEDYPSCVCDCGDYKPNNVWEDGKLPPDYLEYVNATQRNAANPTPKQAVPFEDRWFHYLPISLDNKFSQGQRRKVIQIIRQFSEFTPCLQLVIDPELLPYDYIAFVRGNGEGNCFGTVGNTHERQEIRLNGDCFEEIPILAALERKVGVNFEHTRNDRDEWVKINWHNIQLDKQPLFAIKDGSFDYGRYDYKGLQQLWPYIYSRSGGRTMESKTGVRIGNRQWTTLDGWKTRCVTYSIAQNNCDPLIKNYLEQCERFRFKDCYWEGTAPFCAGRCPSNYYPVARDVQGDGGTCTMGFKVLCCKMPY